VGLIEKARDVVFFSPGLTMASFMEEALVAQLKQAPPASFRRSSLAGFKTSSRSSAAVARGAAQVAKGGLIPQTQGREAGARESVPRPLTLF
jgi:hypothetical protein